MVTAKYSAGNVISKTIIWIFLIAVCIYCLIPFAWMLSTSLKTEAEAFRIPPTWLPLQLTVDSYIGIWMRKNFDTYFVNSTIISLATAVLSTFFGAFAGYGFSRFFFRGRRFLIGFFLATQMPHARAKNRIPNTTSDIIRLASIIARPLRFRWPYTL